MSALVHAKMEDTTVHNDTLSCNNSQRGNHNEGILITDPRNPHVIPSASLPAQEETLEETLPLDKDAQKYEGHEGVIVCLHHETLPAPSSQGEQLRAAQAGSLCNPSHKNNPTGAREMSLHLQEPADDSESQFKCRLLTEEESGGHVSSDTYREAEEFITSLFDKILGGDCSYDFDFSEEDNKEEMRVDSHVNSVGNIDGNITSSYDTITLTGKQDGSYKEEHHMARSESGSDYGLFSRPLAHLETTGKISHYQQHEKQLNIEKTCASMGERTDPVPRSKSGLVRGVSDKVQSLSRALISKATQTVRSATSRRGSTAGNSKSVSRRASQELVGQQCRPTIRWSVSEGSLTSVYMTRSPNVNENENVQLKTGSSTDSVGRRKSSGFNRVTEEKSKLTWIENQLYDPTQDYEDNKECPPQKAIGDSKGFQNNTFASFERLNDRVLEEPLHIEENDLVLHLSPIKSERELLHGSNDNEQDEIDTEVTQRNGKDMVGSLLPDNIKENDEESLLTQQESQGLQLSEITDCSHVVLHIEEGLKVTEVTQTMPSKKTKDKKRTQHPTYTSRYSNVTDISGRAWKRKWQTTDAAGNLSTSGPENKPNNEATVDIGEVSTSREDIADIFAEIESEISRKHADTTQEVSMSSDFESLSNADDTLLTGTSLESFTFPAENLSCSSPTHSLSDSFSTSSPVYCEREKLPTFKFPTGNKHYYEYDNETDISKTIPRFDLNHSSHVTAELRPSPVTHTGPAPFDHASSPRGACPCEIRLGYPAWAVSIDDDYSVCIYSLQSNRVIIDPVISPLASLPHISKSLCYFFVSKDI